MIKVNFPFFFINYLIINYYYQLIDFVIFWDGKILIFYFFIL